MLGSREGRRFEASEVQRRRLVLGKCGRASSLWLVLFRVY